MVLKNSSKPFLKMLNLWSEAVKSGNVKLCVGLAYYKSGKTDDNAGDGINEWCENGNICSEEIRYSRRRIITAVFPCTPILIYLRKQVGKCRKRIPKHEKCVIIIKIDVGC